MSNELRVNKGKEQLTVKSCQSATYPFRRERERRRKQLHGILFLPTGEARWAALLFLFLALTGSLQADDRFDYPLDSLTQYTSKEVVIESFKQNRGLYIQPISASLLTAKEIRGNNIASIKEFSAFIPNLYMPDYGSKMTSPVYIRGIGSRINAPSVALYVDGVPYFDRASFDINISDIERIEVLRGPQGTIYGRNTMGGVINIFTKSPLLFQGTNINIGAGSHHHYKVGASHYGKLSKDLAYSLAGNYRHGGGYFKNHFAGQKADPIDETSARARLSWRATPHLFLDLTIAYEYSDQDGYPYRIYKPQTGETKLINYNAPSYYRRNLSTNGLHVAYTTNLLKISSQSSFQFFDGRQGLDQDFLPQDKYYVDFYQRQQMYSEEINIKTINEDSRYQGQAGVFAFYQNYAQNNDTDYREDNKHALQHSKNPTYGFAVYQQSTFRDVLTKNLSLSAGIRFDWEQTKSTFTSSSYNYGQALKALPSAEKKAAFRQVTPKFSVDYTCRANTVSYFTLSRGYKTGGFNNTAEAEEDKRFDPEYSWNYELGAKSSFFDQLLHLDLSLFLIDWHDQQISQKKLSGQGYILRNAGKSQSKGVEFTAQLNPFHHLQMQLAYGYTHARFKDYTNGEEGEKLIVYNGKHIPMVPSNTLSLSASYTFSVKQKLIDDITLQGQYTGMGKIYWNDINSVQQSYYDQVNAKLTFKKKDLSLDVWTKNIFDKKFIAYHFSAMGTDFIQRGKPFSCGVNINLSF